MEDPSALRVDLIKNAAVPEVLGLRGRPAAKKRVINRDQIDLWEGFNQCLIGDQSDGSDGQ